MIIEVVGKEIEKIKGDFESYLNGLNMVGEISYSQYSELYDEGTKQIQRAYELGKSELEKENAELKKKNLDTQDAVTMQMYTNKANKEIADKQLTTAKELIEDMYDRIPASHSDYYKDVMERARQFLQNCDIDNAIQQANKGLDFDKIADEMEQDLKDSEVKK